MTGMARLIISDSRYQENPDLPGTEFISHATFVARARNGAWLKRFGYYREVGMEVAHAELRPRPFLSSGLLRLLSTGKCWIRDSSGNLTVINSITVIRYGFGFLRDWLEKPLILRCARREVHRLLEWAKKRQPGRIAVGEPPIYLKTDLWFSTQAGGSVTHMAGVINHMQHFYGEPLVFATAPNPLLAKHIICQRILPEPRYWDFRELPALTFSHSAFRQVRLALGSKHPAFIYQRYSLNNYAPVLLSRSLGTPLVTEYNGSEVWISHHWGKPVALGKLSLHIEELNLIASDLIVVVSEPLRRELIAKGISAEKILVAPNGVDTDFFHPMIDASDLRRQLVLEDKTVIGFIGTFGVWHGAEMLVRAFAALLADSPERRQKLRLLMIGDGARLPATRALAEELGISEYCRFTGLVPQEHGPRYLACCDILVAPHIPNADGSPFFGSPTKLFEYLSMGKPIVASRLGQIGDVIEHGRNGWLVEPGKPDSLAEGLREVVDNHLLRAELGTAARELALKKYSWHQHVKKIADALKARCG
jgi:glycosyltransferase involved in cell wall biosynthesis